MVLGVILRRKGMEIVEFQRDKTRVYGEQKSGRQTGGLGLRNEGWPEILPGIVVVRIVRCDRVSVLGESGEWREYNDQSAGQENGRSLPFSPIDHGSRLPPPMPTSQGGKEPRHPRTSMALIEPSRWFCHTH